MAAGCGRFAFDPVGDGAINCVDRWEAGTIAFGAPQPIGELASASHRANRRAPDGELRVRRTDRADELQLSSSVGDPTLTVNELAIVITSGLTAPENDLYYAVRPHISANFGAPVPVPDVNSPDVNDGDGELSQDGCDLFFRSDRSGHDQLYVAHVQ